MTGAVVSAADITGGGVRAFPPPDYAVDIALRLRRASSLALTRHDEMTTTAPPAAPPIPRTFLEYFRSFGPGIVIVLTWLGAGDVVDMGDGRRQLRLLAAVGVRASRSRCGSCSCR